MKNREFYKDKIMNWDNEKDGDFCSNFIESIALKKEICGDSPCALCETKFNLWLDEEYEEPDVDWRKVAVDTPILVRGYLGEYGKNWEKRYFAKFENGVVYAWLNGSTSWSAETCAWWKEAKLAEVNE